MPKTTRNDIDELKIFSDLSTLFASTLELQPTLDETINLVSGITKADACFLYLHDAATRELVLSASKTPHPHEIGHLRIKVGEGITGWVAKHHKTVALPKGAHKDPRFMGALPEDRYEAFLSVPILIKNNVIGVINVQHKKPHAHTPRLISIFSTIGRQVGAAIETARLYDETRRRAKAIEALNKVSHTLVQDRYPEEIMQLIVNMTAQMMGSNICSIMLLDEKNQELKVVAAQSLDPAYRDKPPVKVNGSISGKAVLTRQPVTVTDVRKRSLLSIPGSGDPPRPRLSSLRSDDVQGQNFGRPELLHAERARIQHRGNFFRSIRGQPMRRRDRKHPASFREARCAGSVGSAQAHRTRQGVTDAAKKDRRARGVPRNPASKHGPPQVHEGNQRGHHPRPRDGSLIVFL